jgi:hypothetical protein
MAGGILTLDSWHDFFLMVGGGSAALAGLVFVAMSLNLGAIVEDETHKHRAIGTLTGFTAAFAICALALMGGQGHVGVGLEWLLIATASAYVYVSGYVQAIRRGGSQVALGGVRLVAGTALHALHILGAALLAPGYLAGLYLASTAMVALSAYLVSGAWLLLVGVEGEGARMGGPA